MPTSCARLVRASPRVAFATERTSSTVSKTRQTLSSECWRDATSASSSSGWPPKPEVCARLAEARQRTLGGETCDIHLFPPLSLSLKGVAMGRWLLAQKASAVRVAESSVPSRITEAPAHVGRAGQDGVVRIEF